jgi:hypothetical protein
MKKYLLLFLLISAVGMAQNLNDYQYAQVPAKFKFLKEENQYNINLLCKMFMQKYGFETYYDDEVSNDDFAKTNCNKVFLDVLENNTMFTTKLKIVLKDCKGIVLATSGEGISKEKEYKVAYNEALRMCFDSFNVVKMHKYLSVEKPEIVTDKVELTSTEKGDVLKKEFNPNREEAKSQMYFKKYNVIATETGYNLITVTNDYKFFQIFKTSSNDIFIAKRDSVSGVLIKKNESWFFEYYENNKLISEKMNVRF